MRENEFCLRSLLSGGTNFTFVYPSWEWTSFACAHSCLKERIPPAITPNQRKRVLLALNPVRRNEFHLRLLLMRENEFCLRSLLSWETSSTRVHSSCVRTSFACAHSCPEERVPPAITSNQRERVLQALTPAWRNEFHLRLLLMRERVLLALTYARRNKFCLRLLLIRENEVGMRFTFTRENEFLTC